MTQPQVVSQIPINRNSLSCKIHPVLLNEFLSQQSCTGQINWVVTLSRSNLYFEVKELTTQVGDTKILHLIAAYKLVCKLKNRSSDFLLWLILKDAHLFTQMHHLQIFQVG